MTDDRPYIVYPGAAAEVESGQLGNVVNRCFINESGQVSFGAIDYVPGWFIALHHHRTWELIIIDHSSAGPGYTFFDGQWWRADPGSGVFFPKGYPHAWSADHEKGFKMLWVYGGSHQEAGRIYDGAPESFRPITKAQVERAAMWTSAENSCAVSTQKGR